MTVPAPTPGRAARLLGTIALPQTATRARTVLLLIVIAYAFGLALRLWWGAGLAEQAGTTWQGEPLPTTADSYYYGAGVRQALDGTGALNARIPGRGDSLMVTLGWLAAEISGRSAADVMWLLPALLAGLLAVPLVLIGRLLGAAPLGGVAALLAVGSYSYFNRTIPGYFDTDLLSVTLCLSVVACLMAALRDGRQRWALAAALLGVATPWIHPGSAQVVLALTLTLALYVAVFQRRDRAAWTATAIMLIAVSPLPWPLRLALIAPAPWLAARFAPSPVVIAAAAAVAFVAMGALGHLDPLLQQLGLVDDGSAGLMFGWVEAGDTIREARGPGLEVVAARASGAMALFVVSGIGLALLLVAQRRLLLVLPLLALGVVMGLSAGARFTIYAVPLGALGLAYLAVMVPRWAARMAGRELPGAWAWGATSALAIALTVPVVVHATSYGKRNTFRVQEVEAMAALGAVARPGDYTIAWWDYAYPLWFYSGTSTLIDGAKQDQDMWAVSEILFNPSQRAAANLARLVVEWQARQPDKSRPTSPAVLHALKQRGIAATEVSRALAAPDFAAGAATRDIYLYLPRRMLRIADIVAGFRHAGGLSDRPAGARPFLRVAYRVDMARTAIGLGRGWVLERSRGVVRGGDRAEKIHTYMRVKRGADGGLEQRAKTVHADGRWHAISFEDERTLLIADDEVFRSVFVRLLLLEEGDPDVVEQVFRNARGAVYRFKR